MKVILFGAGIVGERCINEGIYDVIAVIDNNQAVHGKLFCGKPVISLNEYIKNYNAFKIIISTYKYHEISQQLINNNIFNFSLASKIYEDRNVPRDKDIAHGNWIKYIAEHFDKPGMKILEVGSRNVTGNIFRDMFSQAIYTGFDYYEGENVDIVGDAHELSSYFDEKFDLIFSSSVFEHLAMPWKAAAEIIKLLKKDGYIFIETHYSFSSHERPWHFFQFSDNALDVLFPEKFGMRCIKKGCSNLIAGEFSEDSSEYLQGQIVTGLYCHSEYLGQKFKDIDNSELDWSKVSLEDVRKGTTYPKN